MQHAYFDVSKPLILGHRGSAGDTPENTLQAFAAGLAHGAHLLESDVHQTRDGVPVLIHDPSLERTTNGTGLVSDIDFADLAKLDAGYFFQPGAELDGRRDTRGDFPARGSGYRIPSVAEAFSEFPNARFNFEIKGAGAALAREVIRLVEKFDREDRTLLTAGENDVMATLRNELAKTKCRPALGACLSEIVVEVKAAVDGSAPPPGVMALQIPMQFGDRPLITKTLVEHAHAHDIEIHAWTINDPKAFESLLELGIDGIVTDHPGRMIDFLRQRS